MTNDCSDPRVSVESAIADIAEEFLQRLECGDTPSVDEYVERYPKMAEVLREVLPALMVVGTTGEILDRESGVTEPAIQAKRVLGDFRIIREIGRGGMGVVYEAEQLSLGRRVALKVLPFAAVLDRRLLQRFKSEAQAASQLHHTSIVPVYSVGCERGVYYYAMQFVDGRPLSTVIDELRKLSNAHSACADSGERPAFHRAGDRSGRRSASLQPQQTDRLTMHPRSPIDTTSTLGTIASSHSTQSPAFVRSVVALGIEAAEALQHAHDMGVVHRDIKPSNLLLDAEGHLWITDFGLAQYRTDGGTRLTMAGDVLGTIRYMSPEQAAGRSSVLDHRTDIYSLGCTLYELLTLQPVFSGEDRGQLLRSVEVDEPRAPRRLNPAVAADVDTVILKAMAKIPADRYASCRELADDLQRCLDHRPIKAKRPNMTERLAKWSRRHRPLVAAAAVFMVISTIVLSISTVWVWREKSRTEVALNQAEILRARAQRDYRLARDAVDEMTHAVERQLADRSAMQEIRKDLLLRAKAFYESFAEANGDTSGVFAEIASAYKRVGDIHIRLGEYVQAEQAFRNALNLINKCPSQLQDDPNHSVLLGETLAALTQSLQEQGKLSEAVSVHKQIIENLEHALEESSGQVDERRRQAIAYRNLASALSKMGKASEALDSFGKALTHRRSLAESFPEVLHYQTDLAIDLAEMGKMLWGMDRRQEAEAAAREAVERFEQIRAAFANQQRYQWEHVRARVILAEILWDIGATVQANHQIVQAQAFQRELLADCPSEPLHEWSLAWNQQSLCNFLRRIGRVDEAVEACQVGIQLKEAVARDVPEKPEYRGSLAFDMAGLAAMFVSQDQLEQAEQTFVAAKVLCERLVADFPARLDDQIALVRICAGLSDVLRRTKRLEAAEEVFLQASQLQERLVRNSPDSRYWSWRMPWGWGRSALKENYKLMGEMLAGFGDYERAAESFAGAAGVDPNDFYCWYARALAHLGSGGSDAYRSMCDEMLEQFVRVQTPEGHWRVPWTCVLAPNALPDWTVPLKLTQKFMEGYEDADQMTWRATRLGAVLFRAGRFADAQQVLSQLTAQWDGGLEPSASCSPAYAWCFLAMTYHQLGHSAQAQALLNRATRQAHGELAGEIAWQRRLTLELLLNEGRSLLDSKQQTE